MPVSEEIPKATTTTPPATSATPATPPPRVPPRIPAAATGAARGAKPQAATAPAPARHEGPSRLSLTALLGALWAPLFFLMLLLSFVQLQSATIWQRPLQLIVIPLGWAAPFATTVLGLLALGNIQRSNGAQYGLSLALFCAMLFPLGLLDGIVFWVCWQVGDAMGAPAILFRQAIPTVLCVLGDYYLVTRAWAAVQPTTPGGR